jgi:hypothetical protein
VGYIITGADDVFAIDIDSGEFLWQYSAALPPEMNTVCCGWTSRGVALSDEHVYVGQLDGQLKALDRATGEVEWSVQAERWQEGYTITAAPLYVDGMVIASFSAGSRSLRCPSADRRTTINAYWSGVIGVFLSCVGQATPVAAWRRVVSVDLVPIAARFASTDFSMPLARVSVSVRSIPLGSLDAPGSRVQNGSLLSGGSRTNCGSLFLIGSSMITGSRTMSGSLPIAGSRRTMVSLAQFGSPLLHGSPSVIGSLN